MTTERAAIYLKTESVTGVSSVLALEQPLAGDIHSTMENQLLFHWLLV